MSCNLRGKCVQAHDYQTRNLIPTATCPGYGRYQSQCKGTHSGAGRGGWREVGVRGMGALRRWVDQQDDQTRQGDLGGREEGREIRATTKKILTIRREGVKKWAVVRGKGEEGGEHMDRDGEIIRIIEGEGCRFLP